MTIEELKQAQEDNVNIAWDWNGLQLTGVIECFVPPDQVMIKWSNIDKKSMQTDFISIIPCGIFVEGNPEIKIEDDGQ